MAEVQQSNRAGESAARFIEFVMMQSQNASLFLGLIPNPGTGKAEVNLELARMFIDQLAMIQEKTRGNLSTEETGVLRTALTNLQMAFFEVSQGGGADALASDDEEDSMKAETAQPVESAVAPEPASAPAEPAPTAAAADEAQGRKRFTKSYGS